MAKTSDFVFHLLDVHKNSEHTWQKQVIFAFHLLVVHVKGEHMAKTNHFIAILYPSLN
mgnify:CR=1 FL=1